MIKSEKFNTVDELFDHIAPRTNISFFLHDHVFRGHGKESYELVPKALRKEQPDNLFNLAYDLFSPVEEEPNWRDQEFWQVEMEYFILRQFYKLSDLMGLAVPISPRMRQQLASEVDQPTLFEDTFKENMGDRYWVDNELLETAGLAQHYGLPTRLLDWSYDINVALYFAFMDAMEKEGEDENLAIWALNKNPSKEHFDSQLPYPLQFISPPYSNNPNLNAQKGVFTHWQVTVPNWHKYAQGNNLIKTDRTPLDQLISLNRTSHHSLPSPIFRKFILPCKEAKDGLKILERMGYNSASLFPGYQGVADRINLKLKFPEMKVLI